MPEISRDGIATIESDRVSPATSVDDVRSAEITGSPGRFEWADADGVAAARSIVVR